MQLSIRRPSKSRRENTLRLFHIKYPVLRLPDLVRAYFQYLWKKQIYPKEPLPQQWDFSNLQE